MDQINDSEWDYIYYVKYEYSSFFTPLENVYELCFQILVDIFGVFVDQLLGKMLIEIPPPPSISYYPRK